MSELNKKILHNFSSTHNIQQIINFHNITRELLKKEYQFFLQKNKNDPLLKDYDLFDEYLTVNIFLMIYSHAEEFFFHKYGKPETKSRGSIKRYKDSLKKQGIKLDTNMDWQTLLNAELLRDCILHTNKRIDLFNKPEELKSIIKKYKLKTKHKKMVVLTKEFVIQFKNSVINLINFNL